MTEALRRQTSESPATRELRTIVEGKREIITAVMDGTLNTPDEIAAGIERVQRSRDDIHWIEALVSQGINREEILAAFKDKTKIDQQMGRIQIGQDENVQPLRGRFFRDR